MHRLESGGLELQLLEADLLQDADNLLVPGPGCIVGTINTLVELDGTTEARLVADPEGVRDVVASAVVAVHAPDVAPIHLAVNLVEADLGIACTPLLP